MNLVEEVICGFKVSAKRKKVWDSELKMVKIFINICSKYNLKYVAAGGTLLGAIRHKGYIPWDDDIDLMMPRDDYEAFLNIAQSELPENLFLQCSKTEKIYPNGHAQIRNSNTTCLIGSSYPDLKNGKNCGIFIDIFPYDDVPDKIEVRNKHAGKIKFLKKLCLYKLYKGTGLKGFIKNVIQACYFSIHSVEKTIKKIDVISQKYNHKTNTVALVSFMPGYGKNVWDKEWFNETTTCKFEDIEIAIPVKYDEVLRTEFGDYMQLPKDLNDGSMHGTCYFDTEKSYREYLDISHKEFNNLFDTNAL